jgi:hypothetical protein
VKIGSIDDTGSDPATPSGMLNGEVMLPTVINSLCDRIKAAE